MAPICECAPGSDMRMRRIAVFAALLVGLAACANSYQGDLIGSYRSSYKRGSEAIRAENYERAAEQYAFAASSGHPKALIAYGRLFVKGRGVDKDPARAASLFEDAHGKKSAYKGKAAYALGVLLLTGGEGTSGRIDADPARAKTLLVEALDAGETRAASKLGRIYHQGLGVDQDRAKAIDYYRQAASLDPFAARDLARLLARAGASDAEIADAAGNAVSQFEAKAKAGNRGSWVQLADIFSRDEIIEADPERVMGYLENVSDPDDANMQMRLARIYGRIGERRERNRLLRLAADAGDVRAQSQLARLYLKPRTADTNGAVGRYYAERAIGQGSEAAMVYLGMAMLRGDVIEQDRDLAETLLRRASNAGHQGATAALGASILKGTLPARAPDEGKTLLEAAAEAGERDAMGVLGFAYLEGLGVPKDENMALTWLERAANAGHKRAKAYLGDREGA